MKFTINSEEIKINDFQLEQVLLSNDYSKMNESLRLEHNENMDIQRFSVGDPVEFFFNNKLIFSGNIVNYDSNNILAEIESDIETNSVTGIKYSFYSTYSIRFELDLSIKVGTLIDTGNIKMNATNVKHYNNITQVNFDV